MNSSESGSPQERAPREMGESTELPAEPEQAISSEASESPEEENQESLHKSLEDTGSHGASQEDAEQSEPWWSEEFWDKPKSAIWHGPEHDLETKIIGSFGIDPTGREYLKAEGYDSPVPADDVEFVNQDDTEEPLSKTVESHTQADAENELNNDDLPPRVVEAAREHGISLELVRQAQAHGYGIEALIRFIHNPEHRAQLSEHFGIDLPEYPDNIAVDEHGRTSSMAQDPRFVQNEIGQERGREIVKLMVEIAEHPGRVRGTLAVPGGRIPIVRGVWDYIKAWRIFSHHKTEREKTREVTRNGTLASEKLLYDDGFLGFGSEKRKRYRTIIKNHRRDVQIARGKLARGSRRDLWELESDRRNMAERILKIRRMQAALEKDKTLSEGHYDNDAFKRMVKEHKGQTEAS